jgi:elongation factor G
MPPWLVEVAIEPKSKAEREELDVALAELAAEDPSFQVSTDQESGQIILKGMGELHLDGKIDILRRMYKKTPMSAGRTWRSVNASPSVRK